MAGKFKPSVAGVSPEKGQAPASSQGSELQQSESENETMVSSEKEGSRTPPNSDASAGLGGAGTTGATGATGAGPTMASAAGERGSSSPDLRLLQEQLSTTEASLTRERSRVKELEAANESRLSIDANKAGELLEARSRITQLSTQLEERDRSIESLKKSESVLTEQVEKLSKIIAASGASAISDLPEDCYQLSESVTIGVYLNKKIVTAAANKDDIIVVGNENDVEFLAPQLAKGGRRIFAVEKETLAELRKLDYLYK
jgi:hypothetical protein